MNRVQAIGDGLRGWLRTTRVAAGLRRTDAVLGDVTRELERVQRRLVPSPPDGSGVLRGPTVRLHPGGAGRGYGGGGVSLRDRGFQLSRAASTAPGVLRNRVLLVTFAVVMVLWGWMLRRGYAMAAGGLP